MNVMIPYKRDFLTLNKSVINYLPRCSYHLLFHSWPCCCCRDCWWISAFFYSVTSFSWYNLQNCKRHKKFGPLGSIFGIFFAICYHLTPSWILMPFANFKDKFNQKKAQTHSQLLFMFYKKTIYFCRYVLRNFSWRVQVLSKPIFLFIYVIVYPSCP